MDFSLLRGRSKRIAIGQMKKANGQNVDLTGKVLRLIVKENFGDADPGLQEYRLVVDGNGDITTQDGIVLGQPTEADPDIMTDETLTSGWVTVEFDDDHTRNWPIKKLPWEIVLLPGDGRSFTMRSGEIDVKDVLIKEPENL